ncbi:hypothetical protein C1645_806488 [Glomus cerebriforme]|uniref:Uncharacterized protein n=1 Tax=Glomus cerebriforme TaxID=658196 RepID=A0A397SWK0_9GLOM|nr:hypothetical protein C1645_806488 [Glomus cerebriforme]
MDYSSQTGLNCCNLNLQVRPMQAKLNQIVELINNYSQLGIQLGFFRNTDSAGFFKMMELLVGLFKTTGSEKIRFGIPRNWNGFGLDDVDEMFSNISFISFCRIRHLEFEMIRWIQHLEFG